MGGARNFNLAVSGSRAAISDEKEKGNTEEKFNGKQGRKKKPKPTGNRKMTDTKSLSPLSGSKRPAETRESSSEEIGGDNVDDVKLGVSDKSKSKYPQSVIKPEDWSLINRELRPRKQQQPQGSPLGDITIRKDDAGRIIGRRIQVFWPLDNVWYSGMVESFDRKRKRHHVVYDDGDEEWLELARERFKIQLYPDDNFRKTASLVKSDKLGVRRPGKTNQTKRKTKDGKRRRGRRIGKISTTEKDKAIPEKIMDHEEVAKMLSLKKTAPRSKRARIAKQYNQKQIGKNLIEHVNFQVANADDTDLVDIKQQDAQNDGEEEIAIDVNFNKIDDTHGRREGKRKNFNQVDEFSGKETQSPEDNFDILQTGEDVEHANEKDSVICLKADEMKSKKHSTQIRELDLPTAVEANQLDSNQTAENEISNQGSQFTDDKMTLECSPKPTNQLEEKQPNIGGIDEKVNEKQAYVRVSEEIVNEKDSLDIVNRHGKPEGSGESIDEKQSHGRGRDEKVAENLANWDLASVLGSKHGIRKQRSIMKIRLRDSIVANSSESTINKEGHTVNRQSVQSSPSWEGLSIDRQSNLE